MLPEEDPVLCYLVWAPHLPARWWLDTWDMAAGLKKKEEERKREDNEYLRRVEGRVWLCEEHLQWVIIYLVVWEFCHRRPLLFSRRAQQCNSRLKKNLWPKCRLCLDDTMWSYTLKVSKQITIYMLILMTLFFIKGYLKILFNWSSTSFPGNKGLPALASSGWDTVWKQKHS